MTPEYVLRKSLCRAPFCSGPYELRGTPLEEWPAEARQSYVTTAQSAIEYMTYASEYGEPGYSQPKRGILFADWNHFPAKATDILEAMGYEIEWEDEWTTCDGCGAAVRTQPDSYSWRRSYIETEDGCYCEKCFTADDLEQFEDDPNLCITLDINLNEYGYRLVKGDFESGWYPGQNDNPHEIAKQLHAVGHRHLLFKLDSSRQFDIEFSVWERCDENC